MKLVNIDDNFSSNFILHELTIKLHYISGILYATIWSNFQLPFIFTIRVVVYIYTERLEILVLYNASTKKYENIEFVRP